MSRAGRAFSIRPLVAIAHGTRFLVSNERQLSSAGKRTNLRYLPCVCLGMASPQPLRDFRYDRMTGFSQ
jgi:hypothetical protein